MPGPERAGEAEISTGRNLSIRGVGLTEKEEQMLRIIRHKASTPRKVTRRRLLVPLGFMVVLGAMSLGALSASANPAPVPDSSYACVFTGAAGPIVPDNGAGTNWERPVAGGGEAETGVESIVTDVGDSELFGGPGTGDSKDEDFFALVPVVEDILDEDRGAYAFSTDPAVPDAFCVHVDTDKDTIAGPYSTAGAPVAASNTAILSLYEVEIQSDGSYVNTICGTGIARGTDGPAGWTVAAVGGPILAVEHPIEALLRNVALPRTIPGAPPLPPANYFSGPLDDTSYTIRFVGGNGTLEVHDAWNNPANGSPDEYGGGAGFVHITPTDTNPVPGTIPCVNEDVAAFAVAGAFVLNLDSEPTDGGGFADPPAAVSGAQGP